MDARYWAGAIAWGFGAALFGSAAAALADDHPDVAGLLIGLAVLAAKWTGAKRTRRDLRKEIDRLADLLEVEPRKARP
jgi:hypothetical protein